MTISIDWRFFKRNRNNQNFRFSDASVVSEYNDFVQEINYPLYIRHCELCLRYKKDCENGCSIDNRHFSVLIETVVKQVSSF